MCCADVDRLRDELDTAKEMHASAMKTIENLKKPKSSAVTGAGTEEMRYKGQPLTHEMLEKAVELSREQSAQPPPFNSAMWGKKLVASLPPIGRPMQNPNPPPYSVSAFIKEVRVEAPPFHDFSHFSAGRVAMTLELDGAVSHELVRAITGNGRVRIAPD